MVNYSDGDRMIRTCNVKDDPREHWHIAPEEDNNFGFGMVYLERKERIYE